MALFKRKNNIRKGLNEAAPAINKNTYKKLLVKATSLLNGAGGGRENFSAHEYDLTEIKAASEADSYVKMSLMKYSYMLFKAGYMLKSENQKAKDYITTRLYIMGICTKKPIEILFQEIGDDLIKYSNAF